MSKTPHLTTKGKESEPIAAKKLTSASDSQVIQSRLVTLVNNTGAAAREG